MAIASGCQGKKSKRQNKQKNKVEEAKKYTAETQGKLARGTPPDLLDDFLAMLKDDLDVYYGSFKRSKYIDLYARARSMELQVKTLCACV